MAYQNNRSDFSQESINEPLILFVYASVVFWETNKFGELSIKKNIFRAYSK